MLKPLPETIPNIFSKLSQLGDQEAVKDYMELYSPVDPKGRYLPYEEYRHRFGSKDHSLAWTIIKGARRNQYSKVIELGEPPEAGKLILTPSIQRAISQCDRHTTNAAMDWMCSNIGEQKHVEYLLNDLIEDEAISSSQLEGAATTTLNAKEMLKRKRKPRTPDEKMIVGNYLMMQFAWKHRNSPLSLELITELHTVGVENIDDEKYKPGHFRNVDSVVVEDGQGNIVHTPPPAATLVPRLERLVAWVNSDHCETNSIKYIHPMVKAAIIHFAIGYEHPFHDGNGRLARALFYWFMFKNDFGAFRYIAISTLLKAAPIKYGKSYLYTEQDDLDLTYFVEYQSEIIVRAVQSYMEQYHKAAADIEAFNVFLFQSGLYGKLSDKQRTVFQVARSGRAIEFTAQNVKENLSCSYNTASAVLNGLVDLKLFKKHKVGRESHYSIRPSKEIMESWG